MGYLDMKFDDIIGEKITEVHMDEEYLVFLTESGKFIGFEVYGDCCSWSYFHDFVGLDKLLMNGPVKEFNVLDLSDQDFSKDWDYVQCYGYELVTEHELWGDQTTVFSFRNSSNGYYGGSMDRTTHIPDDFCDGSNLLKGDKL
jgi:hypothetical protein